jgi:integrase/recombinase XerD
MIDRDKFMSAAEVVLVMNELRRKAKRTKSTRRNLIIFELATCCGLRVSELIGLRLRDIRLGVNPSIRVPAAVSKGSKARTVPLIWDTDTLSDLTAWIAIRRADGASDDDYLLLARTGKPLDRFNARKLFQRACRITGRSITIHAGRHTFASHALRVRNLADVRDALGHANISTTNIYTHLAEQDNRPGRLYRTE